MITATIEKMPRLGFDMKNSKTLKVCLKIRIPVSVHPNYLWIDVSSMHTIYKAPKAQQQPLSNEA